MQYVSGNHRVHLQNIYCSWHIRCYNTQVLQESTVTGIVSNRIKGKRAEVPRPKLDEKRLLALKGFVILFPF